MPISFSCKCIFLRTKTIMATQTTVNSNVNAIPSFDTVSFENEVNGIAVHGPSATQCLSNSRFLAQEGVSLANPNYELNCLLDKADKLLFHLDTQPKAIRAKVDYPVNGRQDVKGYTSALNAFKGLVSATIEPIVGKSFRYEDVIYEGFGVKLVHRNMNQPMTLKGFSIEDAPFNKGSFFVKLKFELQTKNFWKKLRGYGVKATLVPWDVLNVQFEGMEDVVIFHSMSGLKGKPLDLVAFAHAIGGAELNIEQGVIVPTSGPLQGKAFDLTKTNSVVDKWRNKNAKVVEVSFDYSRSEWEFIKECDEAEGAHLREDYDVLNVEDIDADTVRLTTRVEMLIAKMPLNIEVSLPEESSGKTQLTPEMLSVLTLQNRAVGEAMVAKGDTKRKAIIQLLKMMENQAPEGTPVLKLQQLQQLNELKQTLGADCLLGNDSEVIRAWARKYPNGVVLQTAGQNASYSQYIDFPAVMGISTFIGGSGDGVSHTICQFLRWVPTQAGVTSFEGNIHQEFSLLNGSLKGWFLTQLASKSLRKKMTAGLKGTAYGAKVRTIALPELTHDGDAPNCIPKAAMNPGDDILWDMAKGAQGKVQWKYTKDVEPSLVTATDRVVGYVLMNEEGKTYCARFIKEDNQDEVILVKVFDAYTLNNEYISLFRTPMPMQGGVELVISDKVGVGHVALLMHVWAAFNEGDSDGDGIGIVPLFQYYDELGLSRSQQYEATLAMNTHLMGMAGYAFCYGDDWSKWPCAEFCNFNDAWTKKKIIIEPGSKIEQKLVDKGILPYIRSVPVGGWVEAQGNVSGHYQANVGKSYNLAVIAVNLSLNLQYKVWLGDTDKDLQAQLDDAMATCAVCWRLIYEGMGLAGFSREAKLWFNLLNMSAWGGEWTTTASGNPTFPNASTPKEKRYSFTKALAEDLGLKGMDSTVGRLLVKFSRLIADAKAIENPGQSPSYTKRYEDVYADPSRLAEAVTRRVQRLCSQGVDGSLDRALEAGNSEDDGLDVPGVQSCVRIFVDSQLSRKEGVIVCPWQQDILRKAAAFMLRSQRMVAASVAAEEADA